MTPSNLNAKLPAGELGVLLRHWRDVRGRSQLDLSFDTGVSQRHISFIESGRSVPSRQILMDIAQALDVPLRDRNMLLKIKPCMCKYELIQTVKLRMAH